MARIVAYVSGGVLQAIYGKEEDNIEVEVWDEDSLKMEYDEKSLDIAWRNANEELYSLPFKNIRLEE